MRVKKLNSFKEVLLRISKYKIDWNKDGNSSLERRFRKLIFPYWEHYIVLFQLTIPGSKLKIDFLNCSKKIAVEINGPQHSHFNKYFHNNSPNVWLASMNRDDKKYRWCEQNKIQMLELEEEDLNRFSPNYIFNKFKINII